MGFRVGTWLELGITGHRGVLSWERGRPARNGNWQRRGAGKVPALTAKAMLGLTPPRIHADGLRWCKTCFCVDI